MWPFLNLHIFTDKLEKKGLFGPPLPTLRLGGLRTLNSTWASLYNSPWGSAWFLQPQTAGEVGWENGTSGALSGEKGGFGSCLALGRWVPAGDTQVRAVGGEPKDQVTLVQGGEA